MNHTEQNIINAAKVLRLVHRETNALIANLDEALAGHDWQNVNWQSPNKNWLGLWMNGAQLGSPNNWMATLLHRAYTNPAEPRRVAVVETYLAPQNGRAPVILLAGLSLKPGSNAQEVFGKNWSWELPGPWFEGANSMVTIDAESMRKVIKTALHGRGRLVPLCSVDKTNLVELVADPLLELVNSVPMA
jgi:hypothetical protein